MRQIPEKLLDVTLQPLMFVLLFAYVFGGVIHVPGGSYREYLIGGDPRADARVRRSWAPATSIATDLTEGIVDRFRSLPIARSAYLLGHLIAELAAITRRRSPCSAVSGLIVGWRIHADLPHALAGFALLLLFAFAMLWLGTLLGLLVRSPDAAQGVVFIADLPADVPRERVRPARRPADGAARVRGVEPDQRASRRRPARCSATRSRTPARSRVAARSTRC